MESMIARYYYSKTDRLKEAEESGLLDVEMRKLVHDVRTENERLAAENKHLKSQLRVKNACLKTREEQVDRFQGQRIAGYERKYGAKDTPLSPPRRRIGWQAIALGILAGAITGYVVMEIIIMTVGR